MNRPITTHTGHLTETNKRHLCAIFDNQHVTVNSAFKANRISYEFVDHANNVWTTKLGKIETDWLGHQTMKWSTSTWSWK